MFPELICFNQGEPTQTMICRKNHFLGPSIGQFNRFNGNLIQVANASAVVHRTNGCGDDNGNDDAFETFSWAGVPPAPFRLPLSM